MKTIEQVLCTRRTALLGIAGAVAEMAGCGGGGTGVAGLSSGGTGSFTSGTITGFGSIIVNGDAGKQFGRAANRYGIPDHLRQRVDRSCQQ